MNPFCFFFLPQRSDRGQSEGSCTELLLKVGQFNLRIYCLLTDFVTTCLILKKSRECLVFLRRFRFWDLFSTDINPDTHRKLHTHTHTWNKLPPSRRTAIGWTRDPCLPNVPVSHFSYLTSHWTVFKKRRMQQNQNWGTRMPNGAMKSDFWEPAGRARLLLKHTRTLLFPRTRDGRCVAAFRWKKKKHISELNWRVPYRKFKQLETPSMKRLGKRWKTD